ncbi:DUF465 domain-containing protein [Altericroceibacterium spongiae]|uniref:DUF465 domain-containing protein n=1 Tax=Altericroceibacterium spongiae TaxID=2320269 RepID=A0A420EJZ7_9SPHN|nr:DUF465 domain-containing protein [Altericroceibacterium spongiae]RKF21042.1 DUF465 domain-containing protein [Altericroceibacterium spongiae]
MITTHIDALNAKHRGLEQRLRDERNRPSPNETVIQTLKKQKLRIKEEIALH